MAWTGYRHNEHAQGEKLKATFPGFDLRAELQNPTFQRLTSPEVGIDVETAYWTIHRNELQTAAMQVAAQKTSQSPNITGMRKRRYNSFG